MVPTEVKLIYIITKPYAHRMYNIAIYGLRSWPCTKYAIHNRLLMSVDKQ